MKNSYLKPRTQKSGDENKHYKQLSKQVKKHSWACNYPIDWSN